MRSILTNTNWLRTKPSTLPLFPGYVESLKQKIDTPAEIYAYPKFARDIGPRQRPLTVPTPHRAPTPAPSLRGLWVTYAIVILLLWVVAAIAPSGF